MGRAQLSTCCSVGRDNCFALLAVSLGCRRDPNPRGTRTTCFPPRSGLSAMCLCFSESTSLAAAAGINSLCASAAAEASSGKRREHVCGACGNQGSARALGHGRALKVRRRARVQHAAVLARFRLPLLRFFCAAVHVSHRTPLGSSWCLIWHCCRLYHEGYLGCWNRAFLNLKRSADFAIFVRSARFHVCSAQPLLLDASDHVWRVLFPDRDVHPVLPRRELQRVPSIDHPHGQCSRLHVEGSVLNQSFVVAEHRWRHARRRNCRQMYCR
jgi:hypothetical protein